MKKLFLSSSFCDVASLLKDFAGETLQGKTISFIPTASIPEPVNFYVNTGKNALRELGLKIEILEINKSSFIEIKKKLKNNDYIYVSGGNTFFLLQELKKKNALELMKELLLDGKLYIGESAGSMILAPNIEYVKYMDNVKKAFDLKSFDALNIIDFYPVPHYTNYPFEKEVEKIISIYQNKLKLHPFKNSQVILVQENEITLKSVELKE